MEEKVMEIWLSLMPKLGFSQKFSEIFGKPANHSITIRIHTEIFDMLGRQLYSTVNQVQQPGDYTISINSKKFIDPRKDLFLKNLN